METSIEVSISLGYVSNFSDILTKMYESKYSKRDKDSFKLYVEVENTKYLSSIRIGRNSGMNQR